jgi:hypothetical protein
VARASYNSNLHDSACLYVNAHGEDPAIAEMMRAPERGVIRL